MAYQDLELGDLIVNPANDRHGEVGNEDAAITELFRLHGSQMRVLAGDIAAVGAVYDAPLVMPFEGRYVVFDGNRRVTCAKLIIDPARAPSPELRAFFDELTRNGGGVPRTITCQIENDRNVIDGILFRRHTGSQKGAGQLGWNDRAKLNFVERTVQGSGVNICGRSRTGSPGGRMLAR